MKKFFLSLVVFFLLEIPNLVAQTTLIHYWNFNTLNKAYNNPNIPPLPADFTILDPSKVNAVYWLTAKNQNYAGFIDNNAGDTTNARNSSAAGQSLRFRNPSDSAELRLYIPSTSYKNLTLKWAVQTSSAASGQKTEVFDYSIDSGITFKTSGLNITSADVSTFVTSFGLITVTISDTLAFNNPKLIFRIKFSGNTSGSSGNNRIDNITVEGIFVPPVSNVPLTLMHYWNFNTLNKAYTNPNIPGITPDFSAIDTGKAKFRYTLAPGVSSNYAGFIDNNPGDLTNARLNAPAGQALRFRNPSDSAELRLIIPTTYYSNIVIKYALQSSSAASGQKTQLFDYSTDAGFSWKTNGLSITSLDVTQSKFQGNNWGFVTININDTTVNNNWDVIFRIRFSGNTTGASGNNRFDNITVEGLYNPPVPVVMNFTMPLPGDILPVDRHAILNFFVSGPADTNRSLEFTTDHGLTWTFIGALTGTTYDWLVPNIPSTNVYIRVKDKNLNWAATGPFTIFYPGPGTINIIKPAKGDTLLTESTATVTFNSAGLVSETKFVDYSLDSGKTWKNIGSAWLANSLSWAVPKVATSKALIRVTDTLGIIAVSNLFVIANPPPTSQKLLYYWNFDNISADTVSPKKPNISDLLPDYSFAENSTAKISYYLLPGTSLTATVRFIDPVAGSDTNKRTVVSAGAINNALRLRNPLDSMELRSSLPTTGYNHIVIKYALESSSVASGDSTHLFDYSVDAGATWKNGKASGMKVNGSNTDTLDTTPALYQGTSWGQVTIDLGADTSVDNNPNFIFRIRFKGNASLAKGNTRIDNFTVEGNGASIIIPASIIVTSPALHDTLLGGQHKTITFKTAGAISGNRTIEFSSDSGRSWSLAGTVSEAASFDWVVPDSATTKGLVRVRDSANVNGTSSMFTILVPGIVTNVTVGTGGKITPGDSVQIKWTASGYLGATADIDLSVDSQKTWMSVKHGFVYKTETSYGWNVPLALYYGAVIRIKFASGSAGFSKPFDITDQTAEVSSRTSPATISVSPNPVKDRAIIFYHLSHNAEGEFMLFDLLGKEILRRDLKPEQSGTIEINASSLPSGTYSYMLSAGGAISSGNLIVIH